MGVEVVGGSGNLNQPRERFPRPEIDGRLSSGREVHHDRVPRLAVLGSLRHKVHIDEREHLLVASRNPENREQRAEGPLVGEESPGGQPLDGRREDGGAVEVGFHGEHVALEALMVHAYPTQLRISGQDGSEARQDLG